MTNGRYCQRFKSSHREIIYELIINESHELMIIDFDYFSFKTLLLLKR